MAMLVHRKYLFEGLKDLLPLAKVPKEELQGPRHQGWVVMHCQVEQDPEEGSATMVIQVQRCVLLTTGTQGRRKGDQVKLQSQDIWCNALWSQGLSFPSGNIKRQARPQCEEAKEH